MVSLHRSVSYTKNGIQLWKIKFSFPAGAHVPIRSDRALRYSTRAGHCRNGNFKPLMIAARSDFEAPAPRKKLQARYIGSQNRVASRGRREGAFSDCWKPPSSGSEFLEAIPKAGVAASVDYYSK